MTTFRPSTVSPREGIDRRLSLQDLCAQAVHHEFGNSFQVVATCLELGRLNWRVTACAFQASAMAELTSRIAMGVRRWEDRSSVHLAAARSAAVFADLCDKGGIGLHLDGAPVHHPFRPFSHPSRDGVSIPFPTWPVEAMLVCILANAVKAVGADPHRPEPGRIDVTVACFPSYVQIGVSDNGAGFTGDPLTNGFAGDDCRRRDPRHQGLSLSHRIAGLLEGELRVASEPGVGTRVTIRLPRAD